MDKLSALNIIENIGKLRDGLIVIFTANYIVGYAAWSYIAWLNGFGALPVLDAQYVLAGFPILLSIFLIYLFTIFIRSLILIKWRNYLQKQSLSKLMLLHYGMIPIAILSTGLIIVFDNLNWPSGSFLKYVFASNMILMCIIFFLLFEPDILIDKTFEKFKSDRLNDALVNRFESSNKNKQLANIFIKFNAVTRFLVSSLTRINKTIFLYILPIILISIAIYFYLNTIYIQIPQEFGGAEPRKARLDLVGSDFSKQTLSGLVNKDMLSHKEKIILSKKVTIYLLTKDYLFIGTKNDKPRYGIENKFEILRSSVKSIRWGWGNSS
jgi:hypothetical protein